MSKFENMNSLEVALFASQTGIPVIMWGDPGIGKTAQVTAFAKSRKKHLETIIASIRDPTDFCGQPITDGEVGKKFTKYAAPEWAKNIVANDGGIVFFDEINAGTPRAVMASLLRVSQDKVVGDTVLPFENTWIISAANPPEIATGGMDLTIPLANRFAHFYVDPDHNSFRNWLCGINQVNFIPELPKNWKTFIPKYKGILASFDEVRPMSVQNCPKTSQGAKEWASFRSWTNAITLLSACESVGEPCDGALAVKLVSAAVGQGAAVEFFQYLKNLDLPDPNWLLNHFEQWDMPNRSDVVYAALSSVIAVFSMNPTNEKWHRCWKLIQYVNSHGVQDIGVSASLTLTKLYDPSKGHTTPEGISSYVLPIFKEVENAIKK